MVFIAQGTWRWNVSLCPFKVFSQFDENMLQSKLSVRMHWPEMEGYDFVAVKFRWHVLNIVPSSSYWNYLLFHSAWNLSLVLQLKDKLRAGLWIKVFFVPRFWNENQIQSAVCVLVFRSSTSELGTHMQFTGDRNNLSYVGRSKIDLVAARMAHVLSWATATDTHPSMFSFRVISGLLFWIITVSCQQMIYALSGLAMDVLHSGISVHKDTTVHIRKV